MLQVKNLLTVLGFSSRTYGSLGYFHFCSLVRIHYKLILGDTETYYGGLSILVGLYSVCISQWNLLS